MSTHDTERPDDQTADLLEALADDLAERGHDEQAINAIREAARAGHIPSRAAPVTPREAEANALLAAVRQMQSSPRTGGRVTMPGFFGEGSR